MKLGNTFVRIGSPKFLAGIFSAEKMLLGIFLAETFFSRKFARQIERCLDDTLEIHVQYFSDEFFSCGKHISAERFIFNGFC
jgi:hypothetical protein